MPITKPKARLKINDVEVPYSSFELQAPANALGLALQCALANPQQAIAAADVITFEIQEDIASDWAMLINTGILSGRQARVQLRGDALQINATNPLDDRFALCPRASTVLYDPDETSIDGETASTRADLLDEDGVAIATVFESSGGLDLDALLEYVYVTKLGFDSFVTNIETFPIRRVDFPPSSTWHEAAAGALQLFETYYCPSPDGTVLYILNPRAAMPVEISVTSLGLDAFVALSKGLPTGVIVNAVLLSYKVDVGLGPGGTGGGSGGGLVTDRTEEDDIEVGVEGTAGYHLTHITRHVKDIHDADGNVMRSVNWKTEIVTSSADPITFETVLQGLDIQEDEYTLDWRLKIGHTRTVNARIQLPLVDTDPVMTELGTETTLAKWVPSRFNANEYTLQRSSTKIEGLILTEGDPLDANQKITRVALMDADAASQVTLDGFQTTERGPIRSSIEYWRETGSGQVDVHKQTVDHLTGRMDSSTTGSGLSGSSQQHSSGSVTNSSGDTTATRLFRDLASEGIWGPRKPLQLNAGDVPYSIAAPIALARLEAGGQALRPASIELPGYKASIVRGSVLDVADRDGSEDVLVTSYSVKGESNGRITMGVEGVVIEA